MLNNLPPTSNFALFVFNVAEHHTTINLLSFVVAGFASLMMWLAYRRIRSERWVKYFAVTFLFLGALFLVPFVRPSFIQTVLAGVFSILSNLFGIAAALEIQNLRSLFPSQERASHPRRVGRKWDNLLPLLCWILTGVSIVAIIVQLVWPIERKGLVTDLPAYDIIVASPDMVFSALCVFLLGYAIFANLGARQSFRWMALLIASIYALVQPAYAYVSLISYELQVSVESIRAYLKLTALPLKFFLCAFAYILVVRFFDILSKLGQLQESEFATRQDYLASDGVVKWIAKRLSDQSLKKNETDSNYRRPTRNSGFVNLVIRLPGETQKRVACIVWPNFEKDKRPKVLDWFPTDQEEKRFSPLSTEVFRDRTELWEWEKLLFSAHETLIDDEKRINLWLKDEPHPNAANYDGGMRAVVSMVIEVNGAAIGCLQVARSDSGFSQMAIRQLRQIANVLASAVQSYRELAGLDLMSITIAKRLSDEVPYRPEQAADFLLKFLHDIFAPTVSRLHMDFGFYTLQTLYETERDVGHVKEKIENITTKTKFEDILDTISSRRFPRTYKLLKKQLTARVTQSFGDRLRHRPDKFIMGNLLFAVDAEKDPYNHPALGTNYLHRKTASTLAADAYLDFSRDYYGDILKTLGKELSAKRLSFEEWFKPIRVVLTQQAGFSWVVISQRRRKHRFGDDEGFLTLDRLKRLKSEVTMKLIENSDEIRKQYSLRVPEGNTRHILKLRLAGAEGTVWLGVQRADFGPELDFASPWKTFLVNFAQIADASLSRITIPEKFKEHVEAAQLQGIIASVASTGTIMHQLSTMIAGQMQSTKTLRTALTLGQLKAEPEVETNSYEEILRAMDDAAANMLQIFQSFKMVARTDDSRTCRLVDAARHAFKLFEVSLMPRDISREIFIEESIMIDVSFTVAALALATLVGNSKDAIRDKGVIRIDATVEGESVVCRVTDNGRGITGETQKRIFEPKARTKEYGTGMGLYLTSHSLSEHESSIELTRSDENGSEFTIRFPKAKERTI